MLQLKNLRKSHNLSLKDIGEILSVAESTVSLYENEKREAPYSSLLKLSNYFSVSIDYLLGNSESNEVDPDGKYNIRIPVLDQVNLSESGIEYISSEEKEAIIIGDPQVCFYLKVHGDYMSPEINDGDIALIKKQDDVESGNIAAVISENRPVMLKKVIKDREHTILQPFNSKYESIFVTEQDKLIILGKVIQIIRKF